MSSEEERAMRAMIAPELRRQYPDARIIHELPLRWGARRIDLAAVTPSQIISVEIKSSRDVSDRLESQVRGFLPISSRIIVALAPVWNETLPNKLVTKSRAGRHRYTAHERQLTKCQEIIARIGDGVETWTVSQAGIDVTQKGHMLDLPWPSRMLDILRVSELIEISERYGCRVNKNRPTHLDLVRATAAQMTGESVAKAVCAALRTRAAFDRESDPPLKQSASSSPPAEPCSRQP